MSTPQALAHHSSIRQHLEAQLEEAKRKIAELQTSGKAPANKSMADKPAPPTRRATQPFMQNRSLTGENVSHACGFAPVAPPSPSKKRPRSNTNDFDDDESVFDHAADHTTAKSAADIDIMSARSSKDVDALGGGNFVSLTSCNAALQIASQLSLGRKSGQDADFSINSSLAGHDSASGPSKAGTLDVSCEGTR